MTVRKIGIEVTVTHRLLRGDAADIGLASHGESWSSASYLSLMRWDSPPSNSPRRGSLTSKKATGHNTLSIEFLPDVSLWPGQGGKLLFRIF